MANPASSGIKRRRQWEATEQSSILNFFSKASTLASHYNNSHPKRMNKKRSLAAMQEIRSSGAAGAASKLAPIFTKPASVVTPISSEKTANAASQLSTPPPLSTTNNDSNKKKKKTTQLFLDFGQKNFGKQIVCPICHRLYVHGVAQDLKEHDRICKDYRDGVAFGLASARTVAHHANGDTIVEVRPTDASALRHKVAAALEIVDQELGFVEDALPPQHRKTAFLYVRNKRILGLAQVQVISQAYPLLLGENKDDDNNNGNNSQQLQRSTQPVKAMMGVFKLWTHQKARKQGVASRLVDAARKKLVFGTTVPARKVAFSSPTEAGARFAHHYLQKQHQSSSSSDCKEHGVLVYDLE